jgi:hypothetical protein
MAEGDWCARDEAVLWLAQHYAGDDIEGALEHWLGWANRRAANVVGFAVEAFDAIDAVLAEVRFADIADDDPFAPADYVTECRDAVREVRRIMVLARRRAALARGKVEDA